MRLDWTLDEITSSLGAAWQSPHAPRVVELAIALLIALQIVLLWRDARPEPVSESAIAPAPTAHPRFGASELSQLLGAHLFGASTSEVPATSALAPTAFKLVGLYVPDESSPARPAEIARERETDSGSTGEGGAISPLAFAKEFFGERTVVSALPGAIAWLSVSGAPGQRVQVGDAIGGGTVREIRPEGVTLELGGRLTRVAFPENPYVAMFRGESSTLVGSAVGAGLSDSDLSAAFLGSRIAQFHPAMNDSGIAGYRVFPGADGKAFALSGLEPGDVVVEVNAAEATDPSAAARVLQALHEHSALSLTVERRGKREALALFGSSANTPERTKATPRASSKDEPRNSPQRDRSAERDRPSPVPQESRS